MGRGREGIRREDRLIEESAFQLVRISARGAVIRLRVPPHPPQRDTGHAPGEAPDVRTSRSEDEYGLPDPRCHEGVGARGSRAAFVAREARTGAEKGGSPGTHRRRRHLRDRSRDHLPWPAGVDPRWPAAQQELHARARIYGYRGRARPGRRRIPDRPARHRRNPRRLRPMQALPRRDVHRLPQLRAQLRRAGQRSPR